jgi:hypothetical protein
MSTPDARATVRAEARSFEDRLPKDKRKKLGQYFTGIPLGRLLAHLALAADTLSVLDPMAGHGDLLDAVGEAALERGIKLERLDGIEIDDETADVCRDRLGRIVQGTRHKIISGSAFDLAVLQNLPLRQYDLVITNPPYVRYQMQNGHSGQGESSRTGLLAVIEHHLSGADKTIWTALAKGYSGLADLSVPAWLLSGLLVRPGGRLALVVPATWRSRDYGDVIRYLLLRCFHLEYIVEDTQPGWFSDALVRTHLIVAKRLSSQQISAPLETRKVWPTAHWLHVSPEAASEGSLVGGAFNHKVPEAACSRWLSKQPSIGRTGVQVRLFNLAEEWSSLRSRAARRPWYRKLEGGHDQDLSLFSSARHSLIVDIPEALRDVLGEVITTISVTTLESAGIRVGQGLRTGCNSFFYVDACGAAGRENVRVRTSRAYGDREFIVPGSALRGVLRRQAELPTMGKNHMPPGRVLCLREWVLPEDAPIVAAAAATYRACGESRPKVMSDDLAAYVRLAAQAPIDDQAGGKAASELSAVRTNVRPHRLGVATPRFWYMLPDFTPRHMPAVFVARIVHDVPWVESNMKQPILVDANFSTFWVPDQSWTASTLKALLNSTWCQLAMEALGTPLGGGALKLEAAHVRQLPIPILSMSARAMLDTEGMALDRSATGTRSRIDKIVLNALYKGKSANALARLAAAMAERSEMLRRMRQRIAA